MEQTYAVELFGCPSPNLPYSEVIDSPAAAIFFLKCPGGGKTVYCQSFFLFDTYSAVAVHTVFPCLSSWWKSVVLNLGEVHYAWVTFRKRNMVDGG